MTNEGNRQAGKMSVAVRNNLIFLMSENKMSKTDLVRRLSDVGWPLPILSVRKLIDGTRRFNVDDVGALAEVFGVTISEMVDPESGSNYRAKVLRWLLAEAEVAR